MDKILKTFENMQIWICVAVSILLIATLFLLFDFSPKNNYVEVKNELVMLSESIRKQYKTKPDYWGLNKSNVVDFAPKDMIINNKVVSSIGREFIVGQNELGDIVMPSQRNFMITLANLNKKSCQDIATLDIDHEKHLSLHKINQLNLNGDKKMLFLFQKVTQKNIAQIKIVSVGSLNKTLTLRFLKVFLYKIFYHTSSYQAFSSGSCFICYLIP